MSFKKTAKANCRFHYRRPVPVWTVACLTRTRSPSIPTPAKGSCTLAWLTAQTLTLHIKNNTIGYIHMAQAETLSGWSIYNYKGEAIYFLSRRLERIPMVKCSIYKAFYK